MYERKNPIELDCGIKISMSIIGGKWKSCLIDEIRKGPRRPSELHRIFHDASPRVLNQQLKELEIHGVIKKKIFPELPPRSEYSITEVGKSLQPIIDALEKWGNNYRPIFEKVSKGKLK